MTEREEEEKSRGFKVEDRRRFSAEGELKPEFQGQQQPAAAPAGESRPQTESPGTPPPREHSVPPEEGDAEITFTTFVMGLFTEAQMHLGEFPNPLSNRIERNLPAAQSCIDILGMLQEKTRGNLDRQEEGLLTSFLYELRMKYVGTARNS